MTFDHFANAPTVGSHDQQLTNDELRARVLYLEQRLRDAGAQHGRRNEDRHQVSEGIKPKKNRWKRLRKFFRTVVKPVLDFIPRFVNAVANLKKATGSVKYA